MRVTAVVVAALAVAALAVAAISPAAASAARHATAGVTVTVSGGGTVELGSSGLTCTKRCKVTPSAGSGLILVAQPAAGHSFRQWSGGCFGTAAVCAVAPGSSRTIKAAFALDDGQVYVTVGGPGTVSSLPGGVACGEASDRCQSRFPYGHAVELIAAPAPGALFAGWNGPCARYGTAACNVEVGMETGVTATFEPPSLPTGNGTLSLSFNDIAVTSTPDVLGGCVGSSASNSCTVSLSDGTLVTLAADDGRVDLDPGNIWAGACVGSWPVCSLVVAGAASITTIPQFSTESDLDAFPTAVSGGPGEISAIGYRHDVCSSVLLHTDSCTWSLRDDQTVKLIATPVGRLARFVRWLGSCRGRQPTCVVRIGPDETGASAQFRG